MYSHYKAGVRSRYPIPDLSDGSGTNELVDEDELELKSKTKPIDHRLRYIEIRAFDLYDDASTIYSVATTKSPHPETQQQQRQILLSLYASYQQVIKKVSKSISLFELLDLRDHKFGGTCVAYLLLSSTHLKLLQLFLK